MDWGEGPVGEVSPGERGLLRSFGRSVQTSQALPSVEGGGATERRQVPPPPPFFIGQECHHRGEGHTAWKHLDPCRPGHTP